MAGHGDQVGTGLDHARGDGADTGMADQLHRDQRGRVDLLEVVDQLGQVFDGVDVVVRWWRDQADPRLGITQPCDQFVDLVPGQLAAFAWLGALRDLDLQDFGVDQVLGGDAEAARGDLFDLAALLGAVAHRVFAAFTGVAAAAEPVHRDRQRFVRLRRQRPEADRRGVEAAEQIFGRCHLVQRGRRRGGLELQQVAQRGHRAAVHGLAITLPVRGIATARGALQGHDHVRVVHVVLAAVHVLEHAADIRAQKVVPGAHGELARFIVQAGEADAGHARGGVREAQVDHLVIQPDDLEQLRAAVTGHGTDAHLGDDLGQALVDALAVAAADLRLLAALAQLQDAAPAQVEQGLVGQVRVHRGGTEAEQAGHVVRIARGAGFQDQVDVAAQPGIGEVVMHRAGGQQRMHHRPVGHRVTVAEQQHDDALARGGFSLGADALDAGLQAFVQAVGQIDQPVLVGVLLHLDQLAQLALAEHRRIEDDVVHRLRTGMEDVGLLAELGGQRHDAVFAQRIDRRVGDLRERLAEIIVERAAVLAQHRHRGVIAHRAGGFLLGLGEWAQDLLHFLGAELEQLVIAAQGALVERLLDQRRIDQLGLQVGHALLQPLLVGCAAAVDAVDGVRVEQVAALEVDGHHLARAELALAHHALGRHFPHTGLGGDQEVAVGGQHPARRAQAVAVQRTGGIAPIAGHDAGRAVPRLTVEAVELVERGQVRILELQRLGGRWHQDAQRLDQLHAGADHQLQHVVQALRIRAMHGDHRIEFADVEARGLPHLAARLRPAAVAFDGVDLTVVRQHPERMRQRPARQRVGGKALVEHDRAGGQIVALQVHVEAAQLVRQHHALVADRIRAERGDVVVGVLAQLLFAAAAGQEQRQGEGGLVLRGTGIDEHLFDVRQRVTCELTADAGIGRHHAPADRLAAGVAQLLFQRLAAGLCGRGVVRQEHHAGGEARTKREPGLGGERFEEHVGAAQQQAAAVAGDTIGGDATAVGHARKCGDGGIDQQSGRLVVELGDHAETTGISLILRVVKPLAVAGGHLCLNVG